MNRNLTRLAVVLCLLLLASPLSAALSEQQQRRIDELTGSKGAYTQAQDVYKVSFPRTDVKVSIEGRPMPPFLGLTSWAAFTSDAHDAVMVMGDLVLFEDEVNPVISCALDNGLEVTALHNHFFFERPRVMFMHIAGHGTVDQLASAVGKLMETTRKLRSATPVPSESFGASDVPASSSISAAPLDAIFATKGDQNNGMYKATFGREATMHGRKVGAQMGVNTWAAFRGTDNKAIVDGDFAMLTSELQGVLRSLRGSGINIVAIHNHMTNEEPQFIFLHYWGQGPASELATALKAAMNTQKN